MARYVEVVGNKVIQVTVLENTIRVESWDTAGIGSAVDIFWRPEGLKLGGES